LYDGDARLYLNRFDDPQRLFDATHRNTYWTQNQIVVFNKLHNEPRLSAWYGDPGCSYTYSGVTLQPLTWTEPLLEIKRMCEELCGATFNSVLANLYRDGNDSMGWHADDEPELGPNPTIASVSFGAERRFDLRHKVTKEKVQVVLPHGSVLIMSGKTQTHWMHSIAKTKKVSGPRVNLTYRFINPAISRG
jgi:alkylated DNA repair dioxygenase AlkB